MEILHGTTEDGLRLPGVHWPSKTGRICIVSIHGVLDHVLGSCFAEDVAQACLGGGYGFLFGHHRGYGTINDIGTDRDAPDGGFQTETWGTAFDRFEDCVHDVQLWIDAARDLGYEEVILMGHSMGCNKVLHYLHQREAADLRGLILLSPPDFAGMAKFDPNFQEMMKEAEENLSRGDGEKLLSAKVWGFLRLSSRTFVDFFQSRDLAATLPVIDRPDTFRMLENIAVPMLAVMGSNDNIIIRSAREDLELLKARATRCPDFSCQIIEGANHRYMNRGRELGEEIVRWARDVTSLGN